MLHSQKLLQTQSEKLKVVFGVAVHGVKEKRIEYGARDQDSKPKPIALQRLDQIVKQIKFKSVGLRITLCLDDKTFQSVQLLNAVEENDSTFSEMLIRFVNSRAIETTA